MIKGKTGRKTAKNYCVDDRLIGVQSHNKKELLYMTNRPSRQGKYMVIKEKKPSWWAGPWKIVYTIQKK